LLSYLPVFYIGIEIFRWEEEKWAASAACRLALVTAVVAISLFMFASYENVSAGIYTMTAAALFVWAFRTEWAVGWLRFLGRISYSLYLFHVIVGFPIVAFVMNAGAPAWTAMVAGVAASIAVATVSFEYIESRGVAFGRRLEAAFALRYAARVS
jgi:peptidoglycan/LPS O-acetylase OafA/YrhL